MNMELSFIENELEKVQRQFNLSQQQRHTFASGRPDP